MAFPDLSNYQGVYSSLADAKAAMDNGSFASANPLASDPRQSSSSSQVTFGMQAPATFTPSAPSAPAAPAPLAQDPRLSSIATIQPQVQNYQPTYKGPDIEGMTKQIDNLYANQVGSGLTALRTARDTQLQGFGQQETTARQQATGQRNQADVAHAQAAQRLKEAMANIGLLKSGDNITATSNLNAQRQGTLGAINQQETNTLQDIAGQRSLVNNQEAAKEASLIQQAEADRANRLLELAKYGDERAFQTDQAGYNRFQDSLNNAFRQDQADQAQSNADRNYNLAIRQEHINEAKDLEQRYGIQVEPKDDYQLMLDQVKGLQPVEQRNADQKQLLDAQNQAWKVVEMLGAVPDALSDVLGVPAGTPTQAAKQFAMTNAVQQRQIAISQGNQEISKQNSDANIANMEADNARQDAAVKLSNSQRKVAGEVAGELAQATSQQDVLDYFVTNGAEISRKLGADVALKLKNDALAKYDTTKAEAAKKALRDKAISAAQKDMRWNKGQNAALIKEYEGYYQ